MPLAPSLPRARVRLLHITGTIAPLLDFFPSVNVTFTRFLMLTTPHSRWQRSKPRTPRSQLDQRSTLRRNNANGMRRRRVIRVGDDALNARLPPNTRRALVGEECMVCRDEPLFFPTKTPTKKCKHRPEVCTDCLRRILEEAVYSGPSQGDIARCPSIGCNQWLKRADMYAWADPETIKK